MPRRDVISLGLVALAFTLSIFYYGGDSGRWLAWGTLLLLIGGLIRVQPILVGADFTWGPVHWWAVAYGAWLGALVWLSTLPENSLIFFWSLNGFTLLFLTGAGLERRDWLWLFGLMMVAGLFSAGWGIAEFLATTRRANGPLVDPSSWGSLHNVLFFVTLSVFLVQDRYRPLLGVVLFVFAVAVICSYSRVATAIFVAGLLFIIAVGFRHRALRGRLVTAGVIGLAALMLVHNYAGQDEASHEEGYTLDTEVKGWSQRFSMWRAGLELYRDHPVTGSGPATFKVHYPRYRDANDMDNLGNYVHNDYIQYLAEGGPLLLLFLLAFAGYLLTRLVVDAVAIARGDPGRLEALVLIVAMGTALGHGLMNFVLFQWPVVMVLGLAFARLIQLRGLVRPARVALNRPGLARAGSVLIVVMASVILLMDQLSNDLLFKEDGIPFSDKIRERPLLYFQTMQVLTILRSGDSANHVGLATLYRRSFDQQTDPKARELLGLATALEYQRSLALNPWRFNVRRYFAQFLENNPWLMEFEEIRHNPEELLREGIRLAPAIPKNYLPLTRFLDERGRDDEAYRLLQEKALPWVRMKYDGYKQARLELFRWLLHESLERDDKAMQRRLLDIMNGLESFG